MNYKIILRYFIMGVLFIGFIWGYVFVNQKGLDAWTHDKVIKSVRVTDKFSANTGSDGREVFYIQGIIDDTVSITKSYVDVSTYRNIQIGESYDMTFRYSEDNIPNPYFKSHVTHATWWVFGLLLWIINVLVLGVGVIFCIIWIHDWLVE